MVAMADGFGSSGAPTELLHLLVVRFKATDKWRERQYDLS